MITFVCWKWSQPGYRSKFTSQHVNTLRNMLARHCSLAHELLCVTDDPTGIGWSSRTAALWPDHSSLANQSWSNGPSCYRRLGMFSKDFLGYVEGDYIVSIDLDVIIMGAITSLLDRMRLRLDRQLWSTYPRDIFMWGTGETHIPVCGSLVGFRADGSLSHIWDNFQGVADAREANQTMAGSDQAVIAHAVGLENIARWTQEDGVYSYAHDLCYDLPIKMRAYGIKPRPPANAKIVIFNGKPDPWECTHLPWVKEHYR